jgi:hypothetical protein
MTVLQKELDNSQIKVISQVVDIEVVFAEKENDFINQQIEVFCEAMSKKNQSADYYEKNRGATKPDRDNFLGKKCEYFALKGLRKFGFPMAKPDLTVREGRLKGWETDLQFRKQDPNFPDVHVKGCDDATVDLCQDFSWTFQYSNNNGKFGRDDIFHSTIPTLVAFVFTAYPRCNVGIIKAVVPWKIVRRHLKNPRKEYFIGKKVCVYYADLFEHKNEIEKRSNIILVPSCKDQRNQ